MSKGSWYTLDNQLAVVFIFCFTIAVKIYEIRKRHDYYKTKLKLDKEVGGGDLSQLCTITCLIAYPFA